MNAKVEAQPRGQIMLIVAAGMIVLLGIAALVVDLGFSWMLRRQEQNAADPASLAAARFISDPDPATGLQTYDSVNGWAAACHYARMNGFFDPGNLTCADEADGTAMDVNWPPIGTVDDYWHGDLGHVQVVITESRPSFFGRIMGGTTTVRTSAVAARQRGNTNSNSLVALKPTGCGTARTHGTGTIRVYPSPGYTGDGGYVQVNSVCGSSTSDDNCQTSSTGALESGGTSVLSAPQVNVYGGCKGFEPICPSPPGACSTATGPLNEAGRQLGDPLSGIVFPPWDTGVPGAKCGIGGPATMAGDAKGCGPTGGRIAWTVSPDSACPGIDPAWDCIELSPGVYYGGWNIGNRTIVKLSPGIYVIAGGGISIGSTGALESIAAGGAPAPVLIYNTDDPLYAGSCPSAGGNKCQGEIDLTAGSNLRLAGLRADQPCPPVTTTGGCPFGGMVIWYEKDGSQATNENSSCAGNVACVSISGGSTLDISGTIYSPRAHVVIEGNPGANCADTNPTQSAAVQIISWTWDIGGTGDLCMPYDPSKLFKLNAQGLVH
jgi:hypothetical protein